MLKIAVQNSQFVSKGQTIFYEKAVFDDGWALFSFLNYTFKIEVQF